MISDSLQNIAIDLATSIFMAMVSQMVRCVAVALAVVSLGSMLVVHAGEPAPRPHAPYIAWYQPRLIEQSPQLYRHLTLDAGGTILPATLAKQGALGLAWAYAINNPDAKDPSYWCNICSPEYRRWGGLGNSPTAVTSPIVRPGVALDEWVNPAYPQSEQWAMAGLRQGRKQWPNVFIAVWVTDLTDSLATLVREGTVDLLILECYTHAPASLGPGPFAQSLPGVYHRVGLVQTAGLLNKSIICLGHITDEADLQGQVLTPDSIKLLAADLRKRYPQCPGIAFYQANDRPAAAPLIQACDEIGATILAKGHGTN
jgi:hypothetical protein